MMTWDYPSTTYYHGFVGTVSLLSQGLSMLPCNISQSIKTPYSLLSTFQHYYLCIYPQVAPISLLYYDAYNIMRIFIEKNLTHPYITTSFDVKYISILVFLDPYIRYFVSEFYFTFLPQIFFRPPTYHTLDHLWFAFRLTIRFYPNSSYGVFSADFTELITTSCLPNPSLFGVLW